MMLEFVRAGEIKEKHQKNYYKCNCGIEKLISQDSVRSGHTKSCGCLRKQLTRSRTKTHGLADSKEYRVWSGMIQRCTNPNHSRYEDYGGRGITVCDRWLKFSNFIEDMGIRTTEKHQLDRRDNNAGYSPENCRWATVTENARNARSNLKITWEGKTQCFTAWAEELGIPKHRAQSRVHGLGWTVFEALELIARIRPPHWTKKCHI